jgi:hypothetical protein
VCSAFSSFYLLHSKPFSSLLGRKHNEPFNFKKEEEEN